MNAKRVIVTIATFILLMTGLTAPAQAGKPGQFGGQCQNTWNGSGYNHTLSFTKIPGGTNVISVQGLGYLTQFPGYGFGSTNLIVSIRKPFTFTIMDNDYVYREFYFGGGSITEGYVTYTQFLVQAYDHKGALNSSPTMIICSN